MPSTITERNTSTLNRWNNDPKPCRFGHADCSYAEGGECAIETDCGECDLPFNWHETGCETGAQRGGRFAWEE